MGTNRLTPSKMLVYDLRNHGLVQPAVPGALGVNHHDRSEVAGIQTASAGGKDVVRAIVESRLLEEFPEIGSQFSGSD